MIEAIRTLIQAIAILGLLVTWLGNYGFAQTPSQVNDPNIQVPDYVKRAAQNRPENPSFNEIRQRAITGQVWPGERLPQTLSRSDQKRIATLLAPDKADRDKHRKFLSQKNTGIFKLYPDFDCVSKAKISAGGDCANQVYGGSTHTFRKDAKFSDLRYNNGKLTGNGFFSHEIVVELGDVDIDSLTVDSPGLDFLSSFAPGNDFHSANNQFAGIVSGMKVGEYYYSRSVEPKLNRTYAIRVIAFDNKNPLQKRLYGSYDRRDITLLQFEALQQDKRSDVIVAFRVIRLEEDGNITVVWKQLSRKGSPVINFGDSEPLKGFK